MIIEEYPFIVKFEVAADFDFGERMILEGSGSFCKGVRVCEKLI